MRSSFLIFIFVCAGFLGLEAQTTDAPILEKMISIEFENDPPEKVLERISNLGGFTFSFNPALIENREPVSLQIRDKSIRQTLDLVFDGTLVYKEKKQYVMLLPNPMVPENEKSVNYVTLSGYINDVQTGQRIAAATVFERQSLSVTNTNGYGYFKLRVNDPNPPFELAAFRNGYQDTLWVIETLEGAQQSAVINLQPNVLPKLDHDIERQIIPVDKPIVDTIYDPNPQRIPEISLRELVMWNVTDTLSRKVQVSVLPFVGTNGLLSGNVTNEYSLNIIGGHSMQNTKLELGGVFNSNSGDVSGVQLSGVVNLVGGCTDGLQGAGVANITKESSNGLAIAGVFNVHAADHAGLRAAGVFNYTHHATSGLSLAGVLNHQNGICDGGQIAGALNMAVKDAKYGQIAGALNVATGDVGVGQLAGAVNLSTGELEGVQIAGALNIANKVKGFQLGLVNISDTISGVPLGLLSYVHKGYHHVEVSTDESFRINVAFHTGVRQLYNIFTAGVNPENDMVWYYGYGLGTAPKLGKRLDLNIQVTANWLNEDAAPTLNFLNRAQVGLDYRFAKNFSVFGAGILNGLLTEIDQPLEHFRLPSEEYLLYDEDYSDEFHLALYPGVRGGIRIWW